jgi:hypothetical protein
MFGHNDDTNNNNPHADQFGPSVGGNVPTDDSASPAFTSSAPGVPEPSAPADEPTTAPDPVDVTAAATVSADEPDSSAPGTTPTTDNLIDIKQQALQQLSPLVGHLEQTPEEKFRTTMMMIQASDNQSLIKDAYAAAQAITDEKAKAQALLDIVNEINYFPQHVNN